MSEKTALVSGGSGLVGGHLLTRLLHDDAFDRVVAFVRRPLGIKHPKLVQETVDFDGLARAAGGFRASDAFCALGTTIGRAGSKEAFRKVDLSYVEAFARAAFRAGAERFLLVSALGADPASRLFYNRVKGEAEEAVKAYRFRGLGIFRPSLLIGERAESRPGERLGIAVSSALSFALVGPARRLRPVPAEAVASAMVEAAKEGLEGTRVFESEAIQEIFDRRGRV